MNERAVLAAAQMLSVLLAGGSVVVGALYAGPEILVRRPLPPGQETLVVVVEHFFPVWPFLFGVTGVIAMVAALRRRGVIVGHGLVIGAWAFYGLCLIIAPIRSVPPTPILVGVISLFIVVAAHIGAIRLWAALGVK
ncbi:hypothetical protein [Rhodococcoides fascians]|uniref:hypothetical protein n=1 Tax=Rhodococcoides fascians TaxID=1828 RepID=UPI000566B348|nr:MULTISPECIES: hypothetical protein [Rhodococcus]OZF05571.1 hypothetical protein CH301_04060 [Rhodococcus sp. 15-1189-1-1a]OZF20355.1 hypothetical protein CH299_04605 [Rhodococcus sp. 14-2686-1-2]